MITLKKIPVSFNQKEHTYINTETFVYLKGITNTLLYRLFPDKYYGVPEYIMKLAAERGTRIHEEVEIYETLGTEPCSPEVFAYAELKRSKGLRFLASEYLVSDLKNYASSIDLIYEENEDNTVSIADIKTTRNFDNQSVSWQLSIYSYLLRLNNPKIKVAHLYGIWLRDGRAVLREVNKHEDAEVLELMNADMNNEKYENNETLPDCIKHALKELKYLHMGIEDLTEKYESTKSKLLSMMEQDNSTVYDAGDVKITRVLSSKRISFDTKRLKQDDEETYSKYIRETEVKPTLRITFKNGI